MTLETTTLAIGRSAFGDEWGPTRWAVAPGRLELLGNHVDYNGGLVLAAAIDRRIAIASGSGGVPDHIDVAVGGHISRLSIDEMRDWKTGGARADTSDYVRGIVAALSARDVGVRGGTRLAIAGDVPIGFGMSSSAALCVAAVLTLAEQQPSPKETVLIAQEAEHRAGSPVGAMDQSASVAGNVILFDGSDVSWKSLTPDLGDLAFCVAHSGVSHALSESSYPVRVRESQEALALIRQHVDPVIPSLSEVDWDAVRDTDWLPAVLKSRVRHIVTERERVRAGVTAVENNDWPAFGALMSASGQSSAIDYEISDPLVEELVAELNGIDGVLGARMMGGGEGGPALALVRSDAVAGIRQRLTETFYARHPVDMPGGAFQVCAFGPGATLTDQYPAD
jgi:galactokinase